MHWMKLRLKFQLKKKKKKVFIHICIPLTRHSDFKLGFFSFFAFFLYMSNLGYICMQSHSVYELFK